MENRGFVVAVGSKISKNPLILRCKHQGSWLDFEKNEAVKIYARWLQNLQMFFLNVHPWGKMNPI